MSGIAELLYPRLKDAKDWRKLRLVATPLPNPVGIEAARELDVARSSRIGWRAFGKVGNGRVSFQPNEIQHAAYLGFEVRDHCLVADLQHR
jgi:hypothetical protein